MMTATLKDTTIRNAKHLKTIFNKHMDVFDQIRINADEDGLRFWAMSTDHTIIIRMKLDPTFFSDYNVKKPLCIIVDVDDWVTAFGLYRESDHKVSFTMRDKEVFSIGYDGFGVRTIHLKHKQPGPHSKPVKITAAEGLTYVDVSTKPLIACVNAATNFDMRSIYGSAKALVMLNNSFLSLFSENKDGTHIVTKCAPQGDVKEMVTTFIGLCKLDRVVSHCKSSKSIRVGVGNNSPISLAWYDDGLEFNYLIAPVIDNYEELDDYLKRLESDYF